MSKDYIPFKSVEDDADEVQRNAFSQDSKLYASKRLAKFFEIEVTLKIFGKVVRVWTFPPSN